MEYLISTTFALIVSLSAAFIGLDKDRAFYPICTSGHCLLPRSICS
jgi:hypothetical protein